MLRNRKYEGQLSVPNTMQPSNSEFVHRSFQIPGMVMVGKLISCTSLIK